MLTSILYYIIFTVFGFLAMYFIFAPQTKKFAQTLDFKYSMLTFPYFWFFYLLSLMAAYFLLNNDDFIEPLNFYRLLCPLILSPLIYAGAFILSRLWFILLVTACVAISVFIQPLGIGSAFPQLAPLTLRLLLIVIFSVYCLYIVIFNFVPHIYVIYNVMLLICLSFLSFIGAAPFFVALVAAMLIGALLAYLSLNFYDIKITIDDGASVAFAFLTCNLLLLNLGEFSFAACLTFTAIFWAELLVAIWYKLFLTQSANLFECSNYYAAAQKYNAVVMTLNMLKISGVILLISWFQLFTVNPYSLIIVAFIFALWLNTSIGRGSNEAKSLKQINQAFVSDLKQNLKEAKDAFKKKDN